MSPGIVKSAIDAKSLHRPAGGTMKLVCPFIVIGVDFAPCVINALWTSLPVSLPVSQSEKVFPVPVKAKVCSTILYVIDVVPSPFPCGDHGSPERRSPVEVVALIMVIANPMRRLMLSNKPPSKYHHQPRLSLSQTCWKRIRYCQLRHFFLLPRLFLRKGKRRKSSWSR
jgi:hypothetical protein